MYLSTNSHIVLRANTHYMHVLQYMSLDLRRKQFIQIGSRNTTWDVHTIENSASENRPLLLALICPQGNTVLLAAEVSNSWIPAGCKSTAKTNMDFYILYSPEFTFSGYFSNYYAKTNPSPAMARRYRAEKDFFIFEDSR